jgi:hypothetical protein
MFRTGILNSGNRNKTLDSTTIQDYATVQADLRARQQDSDGKQPGDPTRAARRIVDAVGLMHASTAPFPQRIPLGSDALAVIKRKCEDTLQELKGWETFASSTDFPDSSAQGLSYCRL